ncbi:MAG: hypothetical protein H6Q67_1329 [Firmicutes bacterium]|nr:hypothetical protein [Bacillota bacterium]
METNTIENKTHIALGEIRNYLTSNSSKCSLTQLKSKIMESNIPIIKMRGKIYIQRDILNKLFTAPKT